MTAPTPERLRELLARALEGVTVNASGCVSYPTETAHLSVSFLAKHGAALLHQLADQQRQLLDVSAQLAITDVLVTETRKRAEAAERARDEATGLLQQVKFERGISQALFARIAAFLAASGGANESR